MEKIKVDFSDNGKKKNVKGMVIPPEKAALKVIINLLLTAVVGGLTYYFMLPALNPKSYDFYIFIVVILGAYVVSSFITSGAFKRPEYVPYVKRRATVPVIITSIIVIVVAIGFLVSCPFFRARRYSEILSLENADFDKTVSAIDSISDFDKVPLIDKDAAQTLADKTLGDFASLGLESQFELLTQDSTQINFNRTPYRIYPLAYGDIFKWFTNSVLSREHEGIPGYVRVNLNTQEAQLVTDYDIKYSTAEHFGEYLERVLRFRYPTYIFGEISFEIDETGKPFWVVERIDKTIGLVGGDDVIGIILVDAETGESTYYDNETIRMDNSEISWIDQAYDAELLVKQYNYFGKYSNGFWNSLIGQSGVKQASRGYSFLAIDDDVYLYTGVTSVTSDDSILGFFFINQRTKKAFFYNTTGATESAAQLSAQGKVSDKGWKASFPILLNIDGEATYFMALKDNANIVKSYAMVNVEQYNVVAIPSLENADLGSCVSEYIKGLRALTPSVVVDFTFDSSANDINLPQDGETVSGTITDIRTNVISGTTYYYIKLDSNDTYYYIAASVGDKVVLLNIGDSITITLKDTVKDGLAEALNVGNYASEINAPDADQPAQEEPTAAAE